MRQTTTRKPAFLAVACTLMLGTGAWAQSGPDVFAVVNDEEITRDEVLAATTGELAALDAVQPRPDSYERDRLEILWAGLDSLVEDRLIALEAASLDVTEEQLLFIEVDSNIMTPNDAEVEAFYEANRDQIPLAREDALPQVREYLINQSRAGLRRPMIQRYRQKYGVTTYLDPLRTDVVTEGHPSRGPEDAPVTIVEFGDFQCPFCGSLHPILERVREIYPDTVRIVFRNFPLRNIHPLAQQAAEAAMCARDQGRFWNYHDTLFENQRALEVDDLKGYAAALDLDTATFNLCLDSGRKYDFVQHDLDEGRESGVSGTPTLFINGRFMSGPQPREIQDVIEDELDRAGIER